MNSLVRDAANRYGVRMWRVAEALGMQDYAFSRKLRHELPNDEQEQIVQLIEQLSREKV